MQSPWQILDLDPGSAREKDVKAAYARLIKQHRPDTDPEAFRKVREAYEIGLSMIREAEVRRTSIPETNANLDAQVQTQEQQGDLSTTTSTGSADVIAPVAVKEAEHHITTSLSKGDRSTAAKGIGSLFYTCRAVEPGLAGVRLWQQSLHRATGGRAELVAMGVTTSQLTAELEAGCSLITHACIAHWESGHDNDSMLQLASAILEEKHRVDPQETAVVALRLGVDIGFPYPSIALRLLNFAFPHLDREAREQFIPQVEHQAQTGSLFAGFREDQLAFWHQRFRRPHAPWKWTDPASEAAIEYLASACDRDWEGYELIRNLAPNEWFIRVETAIARQQGGIVKRFKRKLMNSDTPTSTQGGKPLWFHAIWIVPVLGALIFFFTRSSRTDHPSETPAPVAKAVKEESAKPPVTAATTPSTAPAATPSPAPAPAPTDKAPPTKPSVDNSAGLAACEQRAAELRKMPGVEAWNQILHTMDKNNATPDDEQFRREIQSLFNSIAKSEADPAVEQHVLELLLVDPTASETLKMAAATRQPSRMPLSMFLPIWQTSAKAGADQAKAIAKAADWYVKNHGNDLSVSISERQDLEVLAKGTGEKN